MKSGPLFFRITGITIFIQLALGGLLTFDFIPVAPHMAVGLLVFALAIATTVLAWRFKPQFKLVRLTSAILVPLIVIEIVLGFSMLDADNPLFSWIHFIVALAIYGMAIVGIVAAMRWDQLVRKGGKVAAEPSI